MKKHRSWQLTVYDAVERKTFPSGTHNVALQRGFNLIDIEGVQADAFETALASFESEAAPAIQRIIAARSLSNVDDRAKLLNLIALFALRTRDNERCFVSFRREWQRRLCLSVYPHESVGRHRYAKHERQATSPRGLMRATTG